MIFKFKEVGLSMAYNEQGFVQAWDLKNVCPQPLLIEKQIYKISYKSSAYFGFDGNPRHTSGRSDFLE